MPVPLYQVDAFSSRVFSGNPAAICPLESWLPAEQMQCIAAENNLAETAFFIPSQTADYQIRWFTPTHEVELCGHATLAAAYVIFHHLHHPSEIIRFESLSGPLNTRRKGDWLTLDFPIWPYEPRPITTQLEVALGAHILELYQGPDWLAVLKDEATIRALTPNIAQLLQTESPNIIVTAHGTNVDFVSRGFFPNVGIDEDPVTGSAHCLLTPYWASRLNKRVLHAQQLSARGGDLICSLEENRVLISGQAALYMRGEIYP